MVSSMDFPNPLTLDLLPLLPLLVPDGGIETADTPKEAGGTQAAGSSTTSGYMDVQ